MKSNRRDFLKSLGLTATFLTLPGCVQAAKPFTEKRRPPNIIFVMLDELGYFELSCMGNKYLKTPHIDRMASEGMRFTQCLAGSCVCAPTRSTLMTGQHTGHTTVRTNGGAEALRIDDITLAQVLKQAGYATGGFGKWGLGDCGTTGVPEKHGFDTFYGYYHQVHAHSYYPRYLLRNSRKEYLEGNTGDFYEGKTFSHYLIYDEAVKFIRKNKDRPFFCYCPWTLPHGLWGFPKDDPAWKMYSDKSWTAGQRKPTDAKVYASMVSLLDRNVGGILALLKELEIDDNTILFVCGDNGGQPYFKNGNPSKPRPKTPPFPHGFFGPNLNPHTGQRFRGGKGNLYEGGLRIPMLVRWPGEIKSGSVSRHLCYFPDIMPTLAELTGTKPPDNTDGISYVPALLGEDIAGRKQNKHEYLYWEFHEQIAIRKGNYKAVRSGKNKPFELYDLSNDIEEKHNIATERPHVLADMIALARQTSTPNIKGKYLPGQKDKAFKGHNAL